MPTGDSVKITASGLSSDHFALWLDTVLSNTYFFSNISLFTVFKFKLVIDIKLNAIVRGLVERVVFNSGAPCAASNVLHRSTLPFFFFCFTC